MLSQLITHQVEVNLPLLLRPLRRAAASSVSVTFREYAVGKTKRSGALNSDPSRSPRCVVRDRLKHQNNRRNLGST